MILLFFYIDFGCNIYFGKNIFINWVVMFVDLGGIIIEDNVLIGLCVNFLSVNYLELLMKWWGVLLVLIIIKKFVWLGVGVIVLLGIMIGENVIVVVNVIVIKDVLVNVIVVGILVKIICWI